MIPETTKLKIEDLSREDLMALIYEMAKEIRELKAEIARLKLPSTTSQNTSQPPSRDFKSSSGKERSQKQKERREGGARKTRTSASRYPQQNY